MSEFHSLRTDETHQRAKLEFQAVIIRDGCFFFKGQLVYTRRQLHLPLLKCEQGPEITASVMNAINKKEKKLEVVSSLRTVVCQL